MKINIKKVILLFFLVSIVLTMSFCGAKAKEKSQSYNIKIKIPEIQKAKAYLGFYYASGLYIKDSAMFDDNGTVIFKGKEYLPHGVYFLYLQDGSLSLDFVITGDKIDISTQKENPLKFLKDENQGDNNIYRDFRLQMKQFQEETNSLNTQFTNAHNHSDSLNLLTLIKQKEWQLLQIQEQIVGNAKNTELKSILNLMRMSPRLQVTSAEIGNTDFSKKALDYYKNNFWNHVNFQDTLLLRVPVLQNKLEEYFTLLFQEQHTDSLVQAIDDIMKRPAFGSIVYKELLWMFLERYAQPRAVKEEKILVHLVDKYLASQEMQSGLDALQLQRIMAIRNRISKSMIGEKASPLHLKDAENYDFSLENLKSSKILLLFYDPDCDHCNEEIKELIRNKEKLAKNDIKIVTVCIIPDETKWKKYIVFFPKTWINLGDPEGASTFRMDYNIYTAPVFVLLNEEKMIINKASDFQELDLL